MYGIRDSRLVQNYMDLEVKRRKSLWILEVVWKYVDLKGSQAQAQPQSPAPRDPYAVCITVWRIKSITYTDLLSLSLTKVSLFFVAGEGHQNNAFPPFLAFKLTSLTNRQSSLHNNGITDVAATGAPQ